MSLPPGAEVIAQAGPEHVRADDPEAPARLSHGLQVFLEFSDHDQTSKGPWWRQMTRGAGAAGPAMVADTAATTRRVPLWGCCCRKQGLRLMSLH
jgi:hypothetical protein